MMHRASPLSSPPGPQGSPATAALKLGSAASFLGIAAFIAAQWIYLTGNLSNPGGRFAYALADLLYGPVWAPSLVLAVFALRERIASRASRRMSLALLAAALAAALFVTVACIRAANRQYHLAHPELHLENSPLTLAAWSTLVAGVTAAAWHCLGWALLLLASAGWTSARLPRPLCAVHLAGGISALFVFALPELEGLAILLALVWAPWQGILLWSAAPLGGQEAASP